MPRERPCIGCAGPISCRPPTSCCATRSSPQCQKDLGIKLNFEAVNANDIQARITSAVQSGTGPDIIMVVNNWPRLYVESIADVSDVAEAIGKEQGGYYDMCRTVDIIDGKWIGVPWAIGGGLITYRKSWFEEIGYKDGKFPETWDSYRDAGKKLKAKGRPIGQTARPHLRRRAGLVVPLSVVVGRQGGRGRRQDRRAQQQGDHRVGQMGGRRSGRNAATRAGSPGTIRATTAPFSPARSAPPTTAPRSISKPRRSPTAI